MWIPAKNIHTVIDIIDPSSYYELSVIKDQKIVHIGFVAGNEIEEYLPVMIKKRMYLQTKPTNKDKADETN